MQLKRGITVTGCGALNKELSGLLLISVAILVQGCSGVPEVPDNLKKIVKVQTAHKVNVLTSSTCMAHDLSHPEGTLRPRRSFTNR